jgi:two-component system LytT family response regulator
MTPIRTLICEDEPLARETLRDFIGARPELALVGEAHDGAQALRLIQQLSPELVFMDIQMPEMTGLEVLRRLDAVPPVVFTTAYDQHAVTAFELHAVDYLLKPFSRERFGAAVERVLSSNTDSGASGAEQALASRADAPLERVLVRDRGQIFPIAVAEIEYLKSDSKYTAIAARGSQFYVRVPLAELEPRLPKARFLRVHRNAIVNLDFVVSMKPDEQSQLDLLMKDGSTLLANRDASKALRDASI